MSSILNPARLLATAPRVLIVDDDRRVRELLEIALSSHGFAVITAADGDEAILRAQQERPDLVLLDVRLPKRSGLEVCDALRNDPADPTVPIVMISAAAEADQRLHAFTRGADDYLSKPFSPKELVARLRRLLARATESRVALRRLQEMERELASVRREAQRVGLHARREQALRDVADGPARDLLRILDLDALATGILDTVRQRTQVATAALLLPDGKGAFAPWAILGDRFERVASLRIPMSGEIADLLAGLRRPVLIDELLRLGEHREEIEILAAHRWQLIAPMPGSHGLEGIVLAEERADGVSFRREDADALAILFELAAVAVCNARACRNQSRDLLSAAAERLYRSEQAVAALVEARSLLERCAPGLGLAPGVCEAIFHAMAFIDPGASEGATAHGVLASVAANDPAGLAREALMLLDRARGAAPKRGDDFEFDRPTALLRALREYLTARVRGATPDRAIGRAIAGATSNSGIADALSATWGSEASSEPKSP